MNPQQRDVQFFLGRTSLLSVPSLGAHCSINGNILSGIRKWSRGLALPDHVTNYFAAGSVLPIPVTFL